MKSNSVVLSLTIALLLKVSHAGRLPTRIAGSPTTTLPIKNADIPAPAPTPLNAGNGNKFLYARMVSPPTMPDKITVNIPVLRKDATPSSTQNAMRPRIMSPPTVTGTIVDPIILNHQLTEKDIVGQSDSKDRGHVTAELADKVASTHIDSSDDQKIMESNVVKNTPSTAVEKEDEHQEILEGIVGGHLVESTLTRQDVREQFLPQGLYGSPNQDLQSFSIEEDKLSSDQVEDEAEAEVENDDVLEDQSKALEVFHNIMVDLTTINNSNNMTPSDPEETSQDSEGSWISDEDSKLMEVTQSVLDDASHEGLNSIITKKDVLKFGKGGVKDLEVTEF